MQLEQEKVKEENAFDIPSHHLLSNDIFEKFCKRTCREIANQFLVHDYSPDELNIEEKTKRNVMDAVFAKNEYNPMVFRRALAEVILEIHRNGFQKYRQNGGGNGGSIAPKSLAQKGLTVMNVVDNKPPTIVGPAPPRRHRKYIYSNVNLSLCDFLISSF